MAMSLAVSTPIWFETFSSFTLYGSFATGPWTTRSILYADTQGSKDAHMCEPEITLHHAALMQVAFICSRVRYHDMLDYPTICVCAPHMTRPH